MCTDIVIDVLNIVNKGYKASLTLEYKVHDPPDFLLSSLWLLSWPVQHRNINAVEHSEVEVVALVCSKQH